MYIIINNSKSLANKALLISSIMLLVTVSLSQAMFLEKLFFPKDNTHQHHRHFYNKRTLTATSRLDKPAAKILCWVLSVDKPENNERTSAIQDTWGPRCDKLLIVKNGTTSAKLNENQNDILTLPIGQHDGRQALWHKVVMVMEYLHEKYLKDYDWFMKADDDTYIIVENLRKLLNKNDPNSPLQFGHRFKPFVKQGYLSGGSGYVLSREALRRLIERGFRQKLAECHLASGQVEDVHLGQCLEAVSVKMGDSRDELDKGETFNPLSPEIYFDSRKGLESVKWFPKYSYYFKTQHQQQQIPKDPSNTNSIMSKRPIAFHYIVPYQMRFIDYLLYTLKR